jgi:hypothetical protein
MGNSEVERPPTFKGKGCLKSRSNRRASSRSRTYLGTVGTTVGSVHLHLTLAIQRFTLVPYSDVAQAIQSSRRPAALVRERSSKVRDVLELRTYGRIHLRRSLPEALDLTAHAVRLDARFPHLHCRLCKTCMLKRTVPSARFRDNHSPLSAPRAGPLQAPEPLPRIRAVGFLRWIRLFPFGTRASPQGAQALNVEVEMRRLDAIRGPRASRDIQQFSSNDHTQASP